jgi:hypothetical protein
LVLSVDEKPHIQALERAQGFLRLPDGALSKLLEERLGRSVELVTVEALSPFLGPRILAEAEDVLRAA